MVHILFLMLSCLSLYGVSFAEKNTSLLERIRMELKAHADDVEGRKKQSDGAPVVSTQQPAQTPGMVQSILCAPIVMSAAIARFVQSSLTFSEAQETSPWFWQQWNKPAAVDVATGSMIPWYAHAMHGYYQRLNCLDNKYITHYPNMFQRINNYDFKTFNKWHPVQSMKGCKRIWLPLVGPMIAAHATGLAYHAVVEHTPREWYRKKVNSAQK